MGSPKAVTVLFRRRANFAPSGLNSRRAKNSVFSSMEAVCQLASARPNRFSRRMTVARLPSAPTSGCEAGIAATGNALSMAGAESASS